jgi:SAM-dependent methyltransferase
MKNFHYSNAIYNTTSADEIVPYLISLFKPESVIDVGCGLGTWLAVFKKLGVKEIFGIDESEYTDEMLIKRDEFKCTDLAKEIEVNKKFDLALCLEVAEHISETYSNTFISSLTSLSDTIIFSAAIPNQGGQGHVNEQWLEYWKEKFETRGYRAYDIIRTRFWQNENVNWWYRQNIFILSKKDLSGEKTENNVFSMVHPAFYNAYRENSNTDIEKANACIKQIKNGNESPFFYLKLFLRSSLKRIKLFKPK